MNTKTKLLVTSLALAVTFAQLPAFALDLTKPKQPLIQVAILLDTSNSMDGLIDQAKGQLWKIVNEFGKAKQRGQRPELQVALFEYGKSSLPASSGYIRIISQFTTDLDKISEELFALKTNGGDEYCGWVIKDAVERLEWSTASDTYKAIFIAGNEPFTQGRMPYAESCRAAIAKGIMVNTIFCGAKEEGINTHWNDGAALADGRYMSIDQNKAIAYVEAPQDKEIARLSAELNKTYIAYGRGGGGFAMRQAEQDRNASSLAPQGAAVQRALTKASASYRNDSWDLVDAMEQDGTKLNKLQKDELPAEMQTMNEPERRAYVESKSKDRAELQTKINTLNAERSKYLAAQSKSASANDTLDAVVITAVREQAARRNYVFE
jgi:hypothetical protein